jgi:type III pantothenate kinase
MLLTINLGNSNIAFGLFDKDKLVLEERLVTEKDKDAPYYVGKLKLLFPRNDHSLDGVIIGSVVPELDEALKEACETYFGKTPLFASVKLETGLLGLSSNCQLGADRLANMVAASYVYPGNAIVVDMGTATTYEVVSRKREYLGGAIGPGLGKSFEALISAASRLNNVKLVLPEKVVMLGTEQQLNSGFLLGFASMVSGMVQKMKEELGFGTCHIIGTGGFAEMLQSQIPEFTEMNKQLTLVGLRILFERNR